jgi:hypothetical protein
MFHHSWQHDGSVDGAGGLDDAALVTAIDAGARVVSFEVVLSFVTGYYKGSRLLFVPSGESAARVGLGTTLLTGLAGWWGIGLFFMPTAMWRNLRGGVDVTDAIRAHRVARLAAQESQAQAEAEALSAVRALAATAETIEERRAAALVLVERRDLAGAWNLVGGDVTDGPLRKDLPLLRTLLNAHHDRGAWARAGLLAAIIVQEHPDAVQAHLGYVVRSSLHRAGAPASVVPRAPFLSTGRGALTVLLAMGLVVAAGTVGLNEWIRTNRDLHVVNGTPDPVVVVVADQQLRIPAGGRALVNVPEGTVVYEVQRRGATREGEAELHLTWLQRFSPAACVLNVEGAAVLIREQVAWVGEGKTPPALDPTKAFFGEELVVLPGAKPFADFPHTKQLDRGRAEVDTRVVLRPGHPAELVYELPGITLPRALDYLELHARLAPADGRILDVYVTLGLTNDPERARRFLASGLASDPKGAWLLAWERARQLAGDDAGEILAALRALPGPPNAARLAHEARLAPDAAEAQALLRRAAAADETEPLLALAESEAALREGEVEPARAALLRAGAGPAQRDVEYLLARVASEQVARATLLTLERQLQRDRFLVDVEPLLELRAALGGEGPTDAAVGALLVEVGEGDESKGWRLRVRFARAAALGVAKELRALADEGGAPYPALMAALLEGDPPRAAEAAAAVGADPALADDLSLALALALVKGDAASAVRLRPIVVSAWTALGARGAPALEALAASDAATAGAALDRLTLWPTACHAVRLAVAAGADMAPARATIAAPVLPPRGPGYPCAVVRALRAALEPPPDVGAGR